MRVLVACLAMVLLSVTGASATSPVLFSGSWVGKMTQTDEPKPRSYVMRLSFKGDVGMTSYPELGCKGELTRLGSTPDGYAIYRETITSGRLGDGGGGSCIDGVVVLAPWRAFITVGWYALVDGQPLFASARLEQAPD